MREDEELFNRVLQHNSSANHRLDLTSGYLNLMDSFVKSLRKSEAEVSMLTSGPRASSFFNAGRLKRFVPFLYRAMRISLLRQMRGRRGDAPFSVFEYERDGWWFHGKGLWVYEPSKGPEGETLRGESPCMTVVGSSNFSYRSNRRDTESQLYVYSQCEEFNEKLKQEVDFLFSNGKPKSEKEMRNSEGMRVGLRVKLLARLLRSFL